MSGGNPNHDDKGKFSSGSGGGGGGNVKRTSDARPTNPATSRSVSIVRSDPVSARRAANEERRVKKAERATRNADRDAAAREARAEARLGRPGALLASQGFASAATNAYKLAAARRNSERRAGDGLFRRHR